MRNLFDFATKELSQDAFLRWLLENWNCKCEDVKNASRELLKNLLSFKSIHEMNISSLKTCAQKGKIDVLVECNINNQNFCIAIEDKTSTEAHSNQLSNYKQDLSKDKNYIDYQKIYIYYKTTLMTDEEKKIIIKEGWQIFDIESIHSIFSNLEVEVSNCLLKDYIEYLEKLFKDLTMSLPDDISKWNHNHWLNFLANKKWEIPNGIDVVIENYRSQYLAVKFVLKGKYKNIPYLELRSRDFKDGNLILRLLMYGISDNDIEHYHIDWMEKISCSSLFIAQNYSKQVGKNKTQEKCLTVDLLDKLLIEYINEYRKIMIKP